MTILIILLAFLGVVLVLMCCAGMLTMPNTYAKLHYLGPVSSLGTFCIVVAIILQELVRGTTVSQMLAVAFICLAAALAGPLLTHVTARAVYIRRTGRSPEDEPASEAAS